MSEPEKKRGRPRSTDLSPFGVRLRAAIARSRFKTREQFRIAAEVPQSTLRKYEIGMSPRADEVARFARLLNVSVSFLVGATDWSELDGSDARKMVQGICDEWAHLRIVAEEAVQTAMAKPHDIPALMEITQTVIEVFHKTELGAAVLKMSQADAKLRELMTSPPALLVKAPMRAVSDPLDATRHGLEVEVARTTLIFTLHNMLTATISIAGTLDFWAESIRGPQMSPS